MDILLTRLAEPAPGFLLHIAHVHNLGQSEVAERVRDRLQAERIRTFSPDRLLLLVDDANPFRLVSIQRALEADYAQLAIGAATGHPPNVRYLIVESTLPDFPRGAHVDSDRIRYENVFVAH